MELSKKTHYRNVFCLLLILFLDLSGFTLIFPLVPSLLQYYFSSQHVSLYSQDKWLIDFIKHVDFFLLNKGIPNLNIMVLVGGGLTALYSFLQFLSSPVWGKLSDRLGRKTILLISSIGTGLSYALWFMSGSLIVFCFSRALAGFMGGNLGVASAAMADMHPPEKRTSAMGLLGVAFGLGFLLGPAIGGLSLNLNLGFLTKSHPFTGPAFIAFLLSILSISCNFLLFKETRVLNHVKQKKSYWIRDPFSSLRNIKDSKLKSIIYWNAFYVFLFSSFEFSFSFFYSTEYGLTPKQIAYVFVYLGVCYIFSQGGIARQLSKKFEPQKILLIGLALIPLSTLGFGFSVPYFWLSIVCIFPITMGSSLVYASLPALASLRTNEQEQGMVLGVFRSFGSLARALAPLCASFFYWSLGPKTLYILISFFMLLLMLSIISKKKIL